MFLIKPGQSPFYCNKCSAYFRLKANLDIHMKEPHSGPRYSCTRCPKFFFDSERYNRHVEHMHDNQAIRVCLAPAQTTSANISSSSASPDSSGSYATPMNVSIGPKPVSGVIQTSDDSFNFQCNMCPASFRYVSTLKNHMKEPHTGKTFTCRRCKKFFFSRGQLNRHVRMTHNKRMIPMPAQTTNHKSAWVIDIMKNSGHSICPVTSAKLLEDMEKDVVFFQKHPDLTSSLKREFDELPSAVQRLGFPPSMLAKIEEIRQQDQI